MKKYSKIIIFLIIVIILSSFVFYYSYLFHSNNLFRKFHYCSYKIDKLLHPSRYEKTEASKISELKIVSFNIWSGLDYNGIVKMGWYEDKKIRKKRFQLLIENLKKLDADIIALNEVNNLPWSIRKIAKALNYDYISYTGVSGLKIGPIGLPSNLKEGDAILAKRKYGLEFVKRIRLEKGKGLVKNIFSLHTDDATQALIGRIKIAGKNYIIINTHLHSSLINDKKTYRLLLSLKNKYNADNEIINKIKNEILKEVVWRKNSIKILLEYIDKHFKDQKVVLCGDFNATYSTSEIQDLIEDGFYSSFLQYYKNRGLDIYQLEGYRNLTEKIELYTWDPDTNLNIIKYYKNPFFKNDNKSKIGNNLTLNTFKKYSEFMKKKIDYIFLKNIEKNSIKQSNIIFVNPINGLNLSDHYAVLTTILLK